MKDSVNTSCMQDFVGKLKTDMLELEGTKYSSSKSVCIPYVWR